MTQSTLHPPDDTAPEAKHTSAAPRERSHWLHTYKPAASIKWHLLLAAIMWSAVGTLLAALGVRWLAHAGAAWVWPVVAVVIGSIKARFILRRTARRIIGRIRERGEGRCLGGFLSPTSWLLVLVMMTAGRFLRSSHLPPTVLGTVYLTIGAALGASSLFFWSAWREQRRSAEC